MVEEDRNWISLIILYFIVKLTLIIILPLMFGNTFNRHNEIGQYFLYFTEV